MENDRDELQRTAELGMELCRLGEWEQGFGYLRKVVETGASVNDLPGHFYSCLGYALARFEKRYREGVKLGEHAVRIEFYEPANYVNLARIHLLVNDRRRAALTLGKGLRMHPNDPAILELRYEMGWRRRPVVPFLSRDNLLNRWLGQVRAWLSER